MDGLIQALYHGSNLETPLTPEIVGDDKENENIHSNSGKNKQKNLIRLIKE